jgi:hypothetical protein
MPPGFKPLIFPPNVDLREVPVHPDKCRINATAVQEHAQLDYNRKEFRNGIRRYGKQINNGLDPAQSWPPRDNLPILGTTK